MGVIFLGVIFLGLLFRGVLFEVLLFRLFGGFGFLRFGEGGGYAARFVGYELMQAQRDVLAVKGKLYQALQFIYSV